MKDKSLTFTVYKEFANTLKISKPIIAKQYCGCMGGCFKQIKIGDTCFKKWEGVVSNNYKSGSSVVICQKCKDKYVDSIKNG